MQHDSSTVVNPPDYIEFSDSRLVGLYDTLNPFAADTEFYIELAKRLSVKSIIDLGCGTGLLTCELARSGYHMVGVEPAHTMLSVAKSQLHGEKVQWIEGDVSKLGPVRGDLVIMTGHVAQVFLDDSSWDTILKEIHKTLSPGGYIAFESRNPLMEPWAKWTPELSRRRINHPMYGNVEVWNDLLDVKNDRAHYQIRYLFRDTGEQLISNNELVFRTQKKLEQSLVNNGFSIMDTFGNWDRSPVNKQSPELIFVAERK